MRPRCKILIVEDQYFVAIDCELNLQSAGHECVGLATTAAQAIEIAQCEHPDLVIMDIRLAGRRSGVEAAIEIYERFGIRSIFASANADAATHRQAERARPLGWVDKPYSGEELLDAVEAGLQQLEITCAPLNTHEVLPPTAAR
jgi:two-component system, response regulator PdtaR